MVSDVVIDNLIAFLDEIQYENSMEKDEEAMNKVNFCSWAMKELTNSHSIISTTLKKKKDGKDSKKRDKFVDDTFMDWKLPEMTDKEFQKLVNQFDAFVRGWEKNYNKDNEDNPEKEPIQERPYKPDMDDIMEWCELDEVSDYLKDDPELTPEERFELYYDERERRKPKKKESKGISYDKILKTLGISPSSGDDK
jgi:hypothetical protein|tara:strand:+ start:198 stop:782 length:585 start_codon:yes stop_codon:yes gene_type:complete